MRRGIAVLWLGLILILSSIVLVHEFSDHIIGVRGAVHYVNETGSLGAFSSIQDAINASDDGDTVFVYSGTYHENIIVNKTITLIGEDRNSTTINGSGDKDIVYVSSDLINITGFTIKCDGWSKVISGVELDNVNNCRIVNNKILNNYVGINIHYSNENNIIGNNISNNEDGIWLRYSSNNSITYNTITNNCIGFDGEDSSNDNTVSHNNVSNNEDGIWFLYSSNNTISDNDCLDNDWFGIYLVESHHTDIMDNNCSNGFTGIDIHGSSNLTITGNTLSMNSDYGIMVQNSDYISIRNNTVEGGYYGFDIFNIIGLNVTNNYVSTEWSAIDLSNSYYGYIANNTIAYCPEVGINIWSGSEFNLITNNSFYNNSYAFWIDGSENNVISENVFWNNSYALFVWYSWAFNITENQFLNNEYAIYFWEDVLNCNITGNNISGNVHGIYLDQVDNDYNVISENHVANNEFGINITQSNYNTIYHNNFINNTYQASDDSVNKWDNDYPLGGNYWSDYSGVDYYKGPGQDIPGADGIGDTNYTIDSDSKDNYPLMVPYTSMQFENYTILYPGWNLVSIPLIQQDQNITKVLEMIDGYYNAVKWYDASDKSDPWKNYWVGKPFGNDLLFLNETMGFWIYINRPGETIFLYNGSEPTVNQTIQLYEDWNLVGYPSLTSYNRTAGLNNLTFGTDVDAIQWYDAETETWHDMGLNDYFVPCRGYWIHTTQDCVWEVQL